MVDLIQLYTTINSMVNLFETVTGKFNKIHKDWKTISVTKYAWHASIDVPFDEVYRYSNLKRVRLQRVATREDNPSYREILTVNNVTHDKLLVASLYQYNLQCSGRSKVSVWDRGVGILFPDNIREISMQQTIYDIGGILAEQIRRFDRIDSRIQYFI